MKRTKVMTGILLTSVLLYGLLALVMYAFQENFIFYPTPLADDYPFHQFRDFEEVYLQAPDTARLHALFFQVPEPKGILLYFHGNARSLNDWGYAAQDFMQLGYSLLMPDYRSYGKSKGALSESALKADALLWYNWLRENYGSEDLILYGRSLGTGIASHLATQVKAKRLILETPYSSLVAMAKTQISFLPVDLLSRYRFRTDLIIDNIDCPIDLIHGTHDELIPYAQAQSLARGKATLHTIQNGGHNNLSQFPEFHQILRKLL